MEMLVKAGAMDDFGGHRSQLTAAIDKALQIGAAAMADRKSGQASLFGDLDDDPAETAAKPTSLPDVPPWSDKERLLAEKEVLGFYLSSHPMAEYEPKLAAFRTHNTDQLSDVPPRAEVIVGGMIGSIKFAHTKNGKPGTPTKYANFDLEDMQGVVRCILWPRQFAEQGEGVIPDAVVIARGVVDRRGGGDEINLVINELIPLSAMDGKYTHGIRVQLQEDRHSPDTVAKLREIIRGYPGRQDLLLNIRLADGATVSLKSGKYKVEVNPELRSRLEDLLGPASYRLLMSKPQVSAPNGRRG
jgi:DNA polymerase-3 subunit alpha